MLPWKYIESSYTDIRFQLSMIIRCGDVALSLGEQFSGVVSTILASRLRETCRSYFITVHSQSVEKLLLAMENETWERLPLAPTYSVNDIKEVKFS